MYINYNKEKKCLSDLQHLLDIWRGLKERRCFVGIIFNFSIPCCPHPSLEKTFRFYFNTCPSVSICPRPAPWSPVSLVWMVAADLHSLPPPFICAIKVDPEHQPQRASRALPTWTLFHVSAGGPALPYLSLRTQFPTEVCPDDTGVRPPSTRTYPNVHKWPCLKVSPTGCSSQMLSLLLR